MEQHLCVWKKGFLVPHSTGIYLYWLVTDNMIRINYLISEATKLRFNKIYLFSINVYLCIFSSQRYSARLTQFLGALSTPDRDQTYRERSLALTDCLDRSRSKYILNICFSFLKKLAKYHQMSINKLQVHIFYRKDKCNVRLVFKLVFQVRRACLFVRWAWQSCFRS